VDRLDETSSLHLVDNLLLRLGLLDQIGVSTGGSDETERNRTRSVSGRIERGSEKKDDALLDVLNLILLLLVSLHLVGVVLLLSSDVGRVVTTIGQELSAHGQIENVGADGIHEILRVGSEDENLRVLSEVSFKPHDSLEICENIAKQNVSISSTSISEIPQRLTQMIGRFVEKKQVRSNSKSLGERNTHPPSSGHILGSPLHHLG